MTSPDAAQRRAGSRRKRFCTAGRFRLKYFEVSAEGSCISSKMSSVSTPDRSSARRTVDRIDDPVDPYRPRTSSFIWRLFSESYVNRVFEGSSSKLLHQPGFANGAPLMRSGFGTFFAFHRSSDSLAARYIAITSPGRLYRLRKIYDEYIVFQYNFYDEKQKNRSYFFMEFSVFQDLFTNEEQRAIKNSYSWPSLRHLLVVLFPEQFSRNRSRSSVTPDHCIMFRMSRSISSTGERKRHFRKAASRKATRLK